MLSIFREFIHIFQQQTKKKVEISRRPSHWRQCGLLNNILMMGLNDVNFGDQNLTGQ